MIQFDNHAYIGKGDRNLIIKQLSLNGQVINADNSFIYMDIGTPFGKDRVNLTASTYAELAANFFIDNGLENVLPISNYNFNFRRTYGNAMVSFPKNSTV